MDAIVREFIDALASDFWISLNFVKDHEAGIALVTAAIAAAIAAVALTVFTWSLWRATSGLLKRIADLRGVA
jgi:hypothetical protein